MLNKLAGLLEKGAFAARSRTGINEQDRAIDSVSSIADKGDPQAQYCMFHILENGIGVERNPSLALEWLERSAQGGFVPSLIELGTRYSAGDGGVEGNDERAAQLFTEAARSGDAFALRTLGIMRAHGIAVSQDYERALELYTRAARQGDALAQYNLAQWYAEGVAVEQSASISASLMEAAARSGLASAQYAYGTMCADGWGVEASLDNAVYWFTQAADQGHVTAQYNLGIIFEHGEGVEEDRAISIQWYLKAAAQGNERAFARLCEMLAAPSSDQGHLQVDADLTDQNRNEPESLTLEG